MSIIAYVPWIVCAVGLFIYALTLQKHLGLITFGCGLLVGLMTVANHVVRL